MGCKSIPQGFAETLRCAFWVLLASCFGAILAASATQELLLQALEASPEPQESKIDYLLGSMVVLHAHFVVSWGPSNHF